MTASWTRLIRLISIAVTQSTYFVIDSFQQLFDAAAPEFAPVYQAVRSVREIDAGVALPGEIEFNPR